MRIGWRTLETGSSGIAEEAARGVGGTLWRKLGARAKGAPRPPKRHSFGGLTSWTSEAT
jgi:hypothetical protein